MHTMDSNFVAEEMELYDEIRSTLDEDELLIIMSRLQEHFLEKLALQNEQRLAREAEIKRFTFITSDTELTELTETDHFEDSEVDTDTAASIISSTSHGSATSPQTFAYPDDFSHPFHLPPRTRDNPILKATFFPNTALTANNLNRHNAQSQKTATSLIKSTAILGPTNRSNTSKPHSTSTNKYITKPKRGYSDAPLAMRNKSVAGTGISKLKGLTQSTSNPTSPHVRAATHMTLMSPQASAGAYRLDLFCDIKFVKKIFVRWISCKNDVLCHVASRTLGILFSHSYLTADQFLDLAELLLGVHEENNHIFGNVEVTYRESRAGLFYGDVTDSSSSPIDSDYESTPEPEVSSSSDSDLIEIEIRVDNDEKFKENKDNNLNGKKDEDGDIKMDVKKSNKLKGPPSLNLFRIKEEKDDVNEVINKNDARFLANSKNGRRSSVASASSASSRSSRKSRLSRVPYDVHWNNRLYCAMKVLSYIVSNDDVYEGCVVALDEWFSIIVIDLFKRSRKAGIGVLEGFLSLIKDILTRFTDNKDVMGQCKLSQVICSDANNELLDIITSGTSTLVTRASALELCPLLMMTSEVGSHRFAHHCLVTVLDDGRFNPFEPGDITMSRTFQRGEQGQLRSINEKNPLEKTYTVANYIPSLLFQRNNAVFIDQEFVQRLTFLCVIKAMNILSSHIINTLDEEKNEKKEIHEDKLKHKKRKRRKKKEDDQFEDDLQGTVDKLEGEFDSSTARKIRNFFSRDADYTRYRILELVFEDDDVLIQLLLELLLIESALRKSNSRLAQRIRYLFDPFMLFYDFIDCTDADYSFLMDFLINSETVFLEYLLKFCKRMSANWNPTNATKQQVNRVMSILIRLRMHIQDLYQKGSFPYSPKALLKVLEKVEFCYENETENKKNVFDLDYLNYVKKKNIQKAQKEAQEKLKKKDEKSKKPKKMLISSLFLQDVKYQQEQQKRTSEIEKRQKENLARRRYKKKKSAKVKTKKKTDEDALPPKPRMMRNASMASHIMKSNRKKNKNSSKKKHNIKTKINLSNLKKIDFRQRLIHKTVDAEKKVRIGY